MCVTRIAPKYRTNRILTQTKYQSLPRLWACIKTPSIKSGSGSCGNCERQKSVESGLAFFYFFGSALQFVTVWCSMLVNVRKDVLQSIAGCCRVLQFVAVWSLQFSRSSCGKCERHKYIMSELAFVFCVAVCCSVVQCGAGWCSVPVTVNQACCRALLCAAEYCSVLQCVIYNPEVLAAEIARDRGSLLCRRLPLIFLPECVCTCIYICKIYI